MQRLIDTCLRHFALLDLTAEIRWRLYRTGLCPIGRPLGLMKA